MIGMHHTSTRYKLCALHIDLRRVVLIVARPLYTRERARNFGAGCRLPAAKLWRKSITSTVTCVIFASY